MKCSHIYRTVDGQEVSVDVYKDPVTDHGKVSKAGRLDLIRDGSGNYQTVSLAYLKPAEFSKEQMEHYATVGVIRHFDYNAMTVMRTVFENGKVLVDDNLEDIRARARGEK